MSFQKSHFIIILFYFYIHILNSVCHYVHCLFINNVNKIKLVFEEDKYKNSSIKDLKKDYADEIEKLKEALLSYMVENDLNLLKTEFTEK